MNKNNILVECRGVSKRFKDKLALDNINLTVPKGKIVGLLGRNGAGKTTLLKLLNDLLMPTTGEIRIAGLPIGVETKQIVSFLPERSYLDTSWSIQKALHFFQEFYADFDTERAESLVRQLGLNPEMRIATMSKGMKEKLQLILVMSRRAKLYILDEPLGGIDPATRDLMLDVILANFHNDASMIISTHLISDVERILDEVVMINDGKIILTGSADELRTREKKSIDEIFRAKFKI